jgi:hypothetical protein
MTAATEDVIALTNGDLFRRLSAAVRAIPAFSEVDRRSADALGMTCAGITTSWRYPPRSTPLLGRHFLGDYLNPRTCRTLERRPEDVRRTVHAKPRK